MFPNHLDAAWRELCGGLKVQWGKMCGDTEALIAGQREADIVRMQRRYGLTRKEAACAAGCLGEPGVLDDWNDTRSILDM